MTIKEFIKLKQYIKEETEGLEQSEATKVKKDILNKAGVFLKEYVQMEEAMDAEIESQTAQSKQEILDVISEVAQTLSDKIDNQKPQIINKIVKVVEKPTTIKETVYEDNSVNETYDDSELKEELSDVREKIDAIKLPDIEELKEELRSEFGENFKHNIDTYDMQDFRKMGMGLQAQIDDVSARVSAGGATSLLDLGVTASALELNVLDGITSSTTELNFLSTTTSDVQIQINTKANDADVVHDTGNETVAGVKTFSSFPITPNASPTTDLEVANKLYVDTFAQGLTPKQAVNLATTVAGGNLDLTGEETIDGTLTSSSRVLVKNQTLSKENGIYTTGAGAWTRTTDYDAAGEINQGTFITVLSGTANANTIWVMYEPDVVTVGTDSINFSQLAQPNTYVFAEGTAGTDFDVVTSGLNITFNLPTASATNRGALSSADWTTFDGKIDGPGTVADNHIVTFDGTTGKLVQDSNVKINSGVYEVTIDTSAYVGAPITLAASEGGIIVTDSFLTNYSYVHGPVGASSYMIPRTASTNWIEDSELSINTDITYLTAQAILETVEGNALMLRTIDSVGDAGFIGIKGGVSSTGTGGSWFVTAGDGDTAGGAGTLSTGSAITSGDSGILNIQTGASTNGNSGFMQFLVGNALSGVGGDIYFQPGKGFSAGFDGFVKFVDARSASNVTWDTTLVAGNTLTIPATSGTIALDTDLADYVVGPASATDNAFAIFDGTTGKLTKDSVYGIATDPTYGTPAIMRQEVGQGALYPTIIRGASGGNGAFDYGGDVNILGGTVDGSSTAQITGNINILTMSAVGQVGSINITGGNSSGIGGGNLIFSTGEAITGATAGSFILKIAGSTDNSGTDGSFVVQAWDTANSTYRNTTLEFGDHTADRTVTFPNASGTVAYTSDIPDALTDFVTNGNWKVVYTDGSGDVQELALGASGTYLKSNGTSTAPTFATPSATVLSTSGVSAGPASSTTQTITHGLGTTPSIIRIDGIGEATANNGTGISKGTYNSTGNRCVYVLNGTSPSSPATSTSYAVHLSVDGQDASGVINNVGATTFDIVWTATGSVSNAVFIWEAQ